MNSLRLRKHQKFLESLLPLSDGWIKQNKLLLSGRVVTNDCTMYNNTFIHNFQLRIIHRIKYRSVIVEFQVMVRKMTYKGKLSTCKKNIQPTRLLKILDPDSIIKGKALRPFWNMHTEELSKKLWLPTKTDYVDLDLNCLNTSCKHKAMLKSWFSTNQIVQNNRNLPMTSYTSSMSLVQKVIDIENIAKKGRKKTKTNLPIKTKQIKLYPSTQQKLILKQLVGSYRYMYNFTKKYLQENPPIVEYKKVKKGTDGKYILFEGQYIAVQSNGTHKKVYKLPSLISLRKTLKNNQPEWFYDMPSHLMDEAINEFCTRLSTNILKGKKFDMSYKSRKDIYQTIIFEKEAFSKRINSIYPKKLGKLRSSEPIKDIKDKVGSSLTYHSVLKRWILNVCYHDYNKSIKERSGIVSLDPGQKIFMTSYSTKDAFLFGNDASLKLMDNCKKMDRIQSLMTKAKHKTTQSLRKRLHRKIQTIRNQRNDLHYKIINFLTMNYETIILPEFKTKQMVSKLHSKVSRSMNTLSFFQFKQRMIAKCQERGNKLIICTEEYTSKTCTHCGTLNTPQDRNYHCKNCKLTIHRDLNGARNIYLKSLIGELAPEGLL